MKTFAACEADDFYDELIEANGTARPGAHLLVEKITLLSPGVLAVRQKAAKAFLLKIGITFNGYGRERVKENIIPFDIIPRIVSSSDWQQN